MYGADWCGDCTRAKQWFERNNIDYTWIDLEDEPYEIAAVIRYNKGRKSIPVVVFPDGSHLTEPTDAELDAKCAELGSAPSKESLTQRCRPATMT